MSAPPSIPVPVFFKPSLLPAIFVSRSFIYRMFVSVSTLFVTIPRSSMPVVIAPVPPWVIPRITGIPRVPGVVVPTGPVSIVHSPFLEMLISVVAWWPSIVSWLHPRFMSRQPRTVLWSKTATLPYVLSDVVHLTGHLGWLGGVPSVSVKAFWRSWLISLGRWGPRL